MPCARAEADYRVAVAVAKRETARQRSDVPKRNEHTSGRSKSPSVARGWGPQRPRSVSPASAAAGIGPMHDGAGAGGGAGHVHESSGGAKGEGEGLDAARGVKDVRAELMQMKKSSATCDT